MRLREQVGTPIGSAEFVTRVFARTTESCCRPNVVIFDVKCAAGVDNEQATTHLRSHVMRVDT